MSPTHQPGKNSEPRFLVWRIVYHPTVIKNDIPKLGNAERKTVRRAIELKLATDPVTYGKPLRGILNRYWKLRVGDWRIVYAVTAKKVRILVIAHRSRVYEIAAKR